jgi:hypothetical protein
MSSASFFKEAKLALSELSCAIEVMHMLKIKNNPIKYLKSFIKTS